MALLGSFFVLLWIERAKPGNSACSAVTARKKSVGAKFSRGASPLGWAPHGATTRREEVLSGTTILELLMPFLAAEQLILLRPVSKEVKALVDQRLGGMQPKTTPMLVKYQGENKVDKSPVTYFDENQREKFKLRIDENGHFFLGGNKSEFTSGDVKASSPLAQRWHLFAIAPDGTFYVHTKIPQQIHHSSMLAGGNVICAGFLSIQKGKLEAIYNSSGHYQPGIEAMFQTINLLMGHGIEPHTYSVKYEYSPVKAPKMFTTAKIFIDSVPVSLQTLAKSLMPLLYKK
jgi:hypothetical protein